jgi:cell wall assembly regulator SMI1
MAGPSMANGLTGIILCACIAPMMFMAPMGCGGGRSPNWKGEDKRLIKLAEQAYDRDKLIGALERIKTLHEHNGAKVVNSLQKGLDEQTILKGFQSIGLKPPHELVLLYQWRNGCDPISNTPFIWYHDFLPLDRALSEYKTLVENRRLTGWHESWFPVFQFQGEYYFLACEPGIEKATAVRHYFVEETETKAIFANLGNMMETMARVFETGAVWLDKESGAFKDDVQRIADVHQRLNPGFEFPYHIPAR